MVCYGCFAFFLLLGALLVTLVGYYPLDMDHIQREKRAEPAADDRLGSSRGAHNDPENNESMDNEKKPEPTHTHVTA